MQVEGKSEGNSLSKGLSHPSCHRALEEMASADPGDPNYDSLEGHVDEANIYRRNGGCGVVVDGKLYVWGGEGAEKRALPGGGSDSEEDSEEEEEAVEVWTVTTLPPSRFNEPPFDVYDLQTRAWSRQKTSGAAPLLGLGIAANCTQNSSSFSHNVLLTIGRGLPVTEAIIASLSF